MKYAPAKYTFERGDIIASRHFDEVIIRIGGDNLQYPWRSTTSNYYTDAQIQTALSRNSADWLYIGNRIELSLKS